MASVRCGIGVVGVVVVGFANVATTWAQSDELPRQMRERIDETLIYEVFDTGVKVTASDDAANGRVGPTGAILGDTVNVGAAPGSGSDELLVLWENPIYPDSSLDVGIVGFFVEPSSSRICDDFVLEDGGGIVAFQFPVSQIDCTGFVCVELKELGSDFFVYLWEENSAAQRTCDAGGNDGAECTKKADCPDGACAGIPRSVDEPSFSSGPHNLGDGVLTTVTDYYASTGEDQTAIVFNFGGVVFTAAPGVRYWAGFSGAPTGSRTWVVQPRSWSPPSDSGNPLNLTSGLRESGTAWTRSSAPLDADIGIEFAFKILAVACSNDEECADDIYCNGTETCDTKSGTCISGTPIDCDDGDACNGIESCDPETDACIGGDIADCDGNGIDDACDLAECVGDPGCDDCDGNGSLDGCDIAGGQADVNSNGQPDFCEPSCTDNASCDDSEPCSFDRCVDNLCWYDANALYGDVAGEAGVCGPDGDVSLSDILAVLDGFAGQYADGCELVNIDIAGDASSCVPNDVIDLSDILGVLDAFQGSDNCCGNSR